MVFGHFAVSALLHRYLDVEFRATIMGGIFPDALDKSLCQVLRLTPNGRMYAHTLLSLGVSTLSVGLLRGRRAALGWSLGYLGHLLADSSGFVPWFYPFGSYKFYRSTSTLFRSIRDFFFQPKWMEWVLLLWAVWAFTLGRSRSDKKVSVYDHTYS